MARSEAITTFAVSEGSIKRRQKKRREGNPLTPGRPRGQKPTITGSGDEVVRRLVEAMPDATLQEYTDRWNELHDKPISHWTLGRAIRRLNLTRKKESGGR